MIKIMSDDDGLVINDWSFDIVINWVKTMVDVVSLLFFIKKNYLVRENVYTYINMANMT